jgi:peptidoglycan DL-endopeptidase LytF
MNKKDIIIAAMIINSVMLLTIFAFSKKSRPAPAPTFKAPVEMSQMAKAPGQIMPPSSPPKMAAVSSPKPSTMPKEVKPVAAPVKKAVAIAAKPSSGPQTVRVKQGDVLEKLAKQYGVSVQAIMSANNMKNTNLSVGRELIIPKKSAKAVAPLAKPVAGDQGAVYYTVQPGDNPWVIARKNHIKVDDLMKLNNMNKQSAKQLRPGNKLRIK